MDPRSGDTLLCTTCAVTKGYEARRTGSGGRLDVLGRLYLWQQKLAGFWGQHKALFLLSRTGILWVSLAIAAAFFPSSRRYSPYLLVVGTHLIVLSEFIPTSPVPFSTTNAVSNLGGKYLAALFISTIALGVLALYLAATSFSEYLGTVYFAREAQYLSEPETVINRYETHISLGLTLLPIVFVSVLSVFDRFVDLL